MPVGYATQVESLCQMRELRQAIETEAHCLGFELFGVTTPDLPPHLDVYERWLLAGRHGEMGYLASERARKRRADPRSILPECKSVLVLAVRYPTPLSHHNPAPSQGLETYLCGRDAFARIGDHL